MTGRLLDRYLALAFARWILGTFAVCLSIVFLADFVEMMRRASDQAGVTIADIALMTAYRLLFFGEQLLPFAILLGSMAAMLTLSRKLELVVARSVGVSVWQFLRPGLFVSALIGIFAVTVYNPLAADMKERADRLEATLMERRAADANELWLRQSGEDGQSILHAFDALEQGTRLVGVTVFVFDGDSHFEERIDAAGAVLQDGYWELTDAVTTSPGAESEAHPTYIVSTSFTPEQVRETLAAAQSVSFWALPGYIERAREAGLPGTHYRLQYQTLLSSPLFFLAMVFIAATVSLGLFRLGNVSRMILGGVVAGFVLYVAGRLAQDLGGSGLMHPVVAAWTPAFVALLMGLTVLLHQEDG